VEGDRNGLDLKWGLEREGEGKRTGGRGLLTFTEGRLVRGTHEGLCLF
jgi:hypothetical protein